MGKVDLVEGRNKILCCHVTRENSTSLTVRWYAGNTEKQHTCTKNAVTYSDNSHVQLISMLHVKHYNVDVQSQDQWID